MADTKKAAAEADAAVVQDTTATNEAAVAASTADGDVDNRPLPEATGKEVKLTDPWGTAVTVDSAYADTFKAVGYKARR